MRAASASMKALIAQKVLKSYPFGYGQRQARFKVALL
jgi:hypothetical protein